jgi:hypothetical protein
MTTTYGAAIIFLVIALMLGVAYLFVRDKRTAFVLRMTSGALGLCGLTIIGIGFWPLR